LQIKKQTDLSFDEAKKVAIHHLSELARFLQHMNDILPSNVSINWAIELQTLENRISQSSSPCLHENDRQLICDLAEQLTQFNPDTSKQLTQLWNLHAEVFNIIKSNPNDTGYAPRGIIVNNWDEIEKADSLAEKVVSDFKRGTNPYTYASIMATLSTHIDRAERIEYFIKEQLNDAITKYNLKNYDVYTICSIRHKVKKGNEWTTDVRAVRDSIAHFKYSIHKNGDEFEIEFDNDKRGYHFHEKFSQKDFYKFFDVHTLLYKFQLTLLLIVELLPLLSTHFLKRPSAK
jgi:hypothetical protein